MRGPGGHVNVAAWPDEAVADLERAWRVASALPRQELTMISGRMLDTYYQEGAS